MIKSFTAMALSLGFLLLLSAGFQNVSAQTPPSGFASVVVSNQWNEVVGLTFTNDGVDMFVWERGGRVYTVTGGTKRLVLDISEEVGAWHDHGLLGFALHPQFSQNGYIYLLYVVDRHHLLNFGTAAYNPTVSEPSDATIGRLTRYTLNKSGGIYTVAGGSRRILFGEQRSDGFILTERSHGAGSLVFGTDQTLLVSAGDGANVLGQDRGSATGTYWEKAINEGMMTPALNVGAYRSQVLECYNGKILRIDPETGEGIPSNPFYDPARPNSPKSKVWALGFRNPFRMYLKPGSGSHNRADGNPGVLYVGDVGFYSWEEIDVVDRPGMNFGWPMYEGLQASVVYTVNTPNQFAPNPLYQVNGCTQQYFNFQNLIKQATPDGTAVFTNPCNSSQGIPSTIPTFVHSRPIIDWAHDATGPSRTGIFSGQTAAVVNIGAGGSPVSGAQFGGSAAIGGVYYTGTDFPAEYRNKLFFGDYGYGWIRNIELNDQERPVAVRPFINSGSVVVGMATHPTQGGLYYVNFPSEIRRVTYTSNLPPVAVASANLISGPSPLNVQFKGDDSSDPEGLQLSYQWNFGDGSPLSNVANPAHTFTTSGTAPTQFNVILKVTDNGGLQAQTTMIISVNNTAPNVTITSPLDGTLYPLTGETIYPLRADVTDLEHSASQLSYKWQTTLHHESHSHPEPVDTSPETTTHVSPLGCDGETYFVVISLTVTDAAGLSTTKTVTLYPDCSSISKITPVITWPNPSPITVGTALSSTQLNATATHNGSPVAGSFVYTPSAGTVLGPGTGQQLSVSFTPGNTTLYNPVSKTVTIDVNQSGQSTFYRAININGPALVIDGNNWISSTGAPNFSFTTNRSVAANQNVTLVPPTDANRATMIRSFVWGSTVSLNMTAVPQGNYQVWVYVWEDNSPETYSISLEGSVVQPNFNSGTAGTWRKLGPYAVNITDGAINVSSSGGYVNFSGMEVWTAGPPPSNQPPVVANPIPNQSATAGVPYTYAFPANTFSDPNAGTTLTYSATLEGGGALPGWLTFTGTTRTFSGTPALANLGSINIRVTASDGAPGGTVSDVFALNVIESGQSSFYRAININGPALVIDGNNWISSTGAPNFSFTTSNSVMANQGVTLVPATDANRATMIRSSVWGNTVTLNMTAVPSGNYQVWLYVWEDNFAQTYSISLEGSVVLSNFNSGTAGTWRKLGPYPVNITDGAINMSSSGGQGNFSGIEVWTVGSPPANQPPVVSNPIVDQNAMAGVAFSYAFPANTFSDPNAGTTLTYTATLDGGGSLPGWLTFTGSTRTFSGTPALANLGSINIRVTASDGAPGGTVSDVFALNVIDAVKVTPVITWSNPLPITVGTALSTTQLNATASYNGSPVAGSFVYTPPAGTVLNVGTGQQLSVSFTPTNTVLYNAANATVTIDVNASSPSTFYRAININGPARVIDGNNWISSTGAPNFSFTTNNTTFSNQAITLIPATDTNRATMIRSSVYGNTVTLNMTAVPSGNYQVWLYVWEDNFAETYSISLEGSLVQSNFTSGPAGAWTKLGPYPVNITDGAINVSSSGGHANFSGIEVWTGTSGAAAKTSAIARTATLEEETTDNNAALEASPNPFSTKLNVRFTARQSANARVELFDMRGRSVHLLYSGKMSAGETKEKELETSELPDGIYILQFVNGRHVSRLKLMGVQ